MDTLLDTIKTAGMVMMATYGAANVGAGVGQAFSPADHIFVFDAMKDARGEGQPSRIALGFTLIGTVGGAMIANTVNPNRYNTPTPLKFHQ